MSLSCMVFSWVAHSFSMSFSRFFLYGQPKKTFLLFIAFFFTNINKNQTKRKDRKRSPPQPTLHRRPKRRGIETQLQEKPLRKFYDLKKKRLKKSYKRLKNPALFHHWIFSVFFPRICFTKKTKHRGPRHFTAVMEPTGRCREPNSMTSTGSSGWVRWFWCRSERVTGDFFFRVVFVIYK